MKFHKQLCKLFQNKGHCPWYCCTFLTAESIKTKSPVYQESHENISCNKINLQDILSSEFHDTFWSRTILKNNWYLRHLFSYHLALLPWFWGQTKPMWSGGTQGDKASYSFFKQPIANCSTSIGCLAADMYLRYQLF